MRNGKATHIQTDDDNSKVIDDLIKQMAPIDPISMALRYPVDKAGEKNQKLEFVNLENLRETLVRVSLVFDGVTMQMGHYVDMTESMVSDMYANYW
jgi:hypothetical protein